MNAPLPGEPARSPAQSEPRASARGQGAARLARRELERLAEEVGDMLAQRGETLAVGETSAGGALASALHAVAALEARFRGGMVLYGGNDAPLARDMGGIASAHGVVSEEYVTALARNVRRMFACQWALAESGIAGPQTGRRSAKPVGMVCLAVAGPVAEGISAPERGTSPRATEGPVGDAERARGRGTSPRATEVPIGDAERARGRGTSPRATAEVHDGQERVWTATRLLPDGGRAANQTRFALESLRLLRCALLARRQE